MRSTWVSAIRFAAVPFLVGMGSNRLANAVPWDVFSDPVSGSVCDVVNAANLEVVVLSDTGELVVVTEEDYLLDAAASVDVDGVFFYGGIPVGEVSFADDGDGFRTLWLLAPDDTVIELNPLTGEPIFTNLIPDDFVDVPCDALDLWDDDDLDDVPDEFDLCLDTPPDEPVDADGCACFEVDSDGDGFDDCDDECPFDFGDNDFGCPCDAFDEDDDGINDCFDDCPNTPLGADVDADGCAIVIVVEPPPPVFITCGGLSSLTLAMTFGLLFALRLARRRC